MGITEWILTSLNSSPANYGALKRSYMPSVYPNKKASAVNRSPSSFATTLSRLKKKGFIVRDPARRWNVTEKGKSKLAQLHKKESGSRHPHRTKANKRIENVIIIFDIPKQQKAQRSWLEKELATLGFHPLQRSVWIGAGSLPKKFLKDMRDLNILDRIHIFGIKNPGTISKKRSQARISI